MMVIDLWSVKKSSVRVLQFIKKMEMLVAVIPCTEVVFTLEEKGETSSVNSLNRDLLVRYTKHRTRINWGEIIETYQLAEEKGINDMALHVS